MSSTESSPARAHFCIKCNFPIAVYGRLSPCLHAYCLTCSSDMTSCFLCKASTVRIERIPAEQGLHISAGTLQAFKSQAELEQHAKELSDRIASRQMVAF